MTETAIDIKDRFAGCLLGLAVGDALGAPFEGLSTDVMRSRYASVAGFLSAVPEGEWWYTDDTQMAIGVAETLVQCHGIEEAELCRRFAENYRPQRGYGRGSKILLQAMLDGQDYRALAADHLPGGSFGNGAAMRVAPVGLFFRHDHELLCQQARASATPTHVHPLAIEGAQLLALAVGILSGAQSFDRMVFFDRLTAHVQSAEYAGPLRRARSIDSRRDLPLFGNGIEATSSVVTAIACFALTPGSFQETVATAIMLGGDTDTVAAMAGALSGAHLGLRALPTPWLDRLEDRHQGRSYLLDLSARLAAAHCDIAQQ